MHKTTLDILKNFATINSGILIRKSNVLRSVSVAKNILARAEVPDSFPHEFAIYNLNEFLSTYRLFDNPEVSYNQDHILLKDSHSRVKYKYSSPAVVVAAPEKDLSIDDPLIEFELSSDYLDRIQKAAAVMQLSTLEISSEGLRAFNHKNNGGNEFRSLPKNMRVSEGAGAHNVDISLLKVIPTTYQVKMSDRFIQMDGSIDGVALRYAIAVGSAE